MRFNLIAASLTWILKNLGSTESAIQPGESVVGVGDDNKVGRGRNKLDRSELDDGEVDGGEIEDNEVRKNVQKTSKSKNSSKSKKTVESSDFLTLGAKLAFIKLNPAFFKALILHHLNPEYYIRIKMDISGYAIGGVLNQQTSDDSGR